MEGFAVKGGRRLSGEVSINGAKNCILVQMAAAVLTEEEVVIRDCPEISDIDNMMSILRSLGAKAYREGSNVIVKAEGIGNFEISSECGTKIRSSVFLLGPLLSRFKRASAVFPGGCSIGKRPVDYHTAGFRALKGKVSEEGGRIVCHGEEMEGGEVCVSGSVGATENMIMAAVLLEGETLINGCALEPEITALCNMLNSMGARITQRGSRIRVKGVKKLGGTVVLPIPDRIVSGTYIAAAALTEGELYIKNAAVRHLRAFIEKTDGYSCDVRYYGSDLSVRGRERKQGVGLIRTGGYPAFPTDLQAPLCSVLCVSRGRSVIEENIFETRFKYTDELKKMGADISVAGRGAYIRGVDTLIGSEVYAKDLRGGAALVLAALGAEGDSVVWGAEHIDRGYEHIESKLTGLGGMIERISC